MSDDGIVAMAIRRYTLRYGLPHSLAGGSRDDVAECAVCHFRGTRREVLDHVTTRNLADHAARGWP